jgi:hypothetical protein
MHRLDSKTEPKLLDKDGLEPGIMDQENPPYGDEFVMCLPANIPGFNMQKKNWSIATLPYHAMK